MKKVKKVFILICCSIFFHTTISDSSLNFDNLKKAVVSIEVKTLKEIGAEKFLITEKGAGFIVDPSGWIITNCHIVESLFLDPDLNDGKIVNNELEVTLFDGRKCSADYVSICFLNLDTALFKVDCGKEKLPFLLISNKSPQKGDEIILLGLKNIKEGLVIDTNGISQSIIITASFEKGWSGTPVLNCEREVIGIASFTYFEKDSGKEKFAVIPINKSLLKSINKSKE